MSDLIFWYTGWFIWAIIGAVAFFLVMIGLLLLYFKARHLRSMYRLMGINPEVILVLRKGLSVVEKQEVFNALVKASKLCAKLQLDFDMKRALKDMPIYDLYDKAMYLGSEVCVVARGTWNGYYRYEVRYTEKMRNDILVANLTALDLKPVGEEGTIQ